MGLEQLISWLTAIGAVEYLWLFITAPLLLVYFLLRRRKASFKLEVSGQVSVCGQRLRCQHCAYHRFVKSEGLAATNMLFGLAKRGWNRKPRGFICARCGFVHSFMISTEEIEFVQDPHPAQEIERPV